MSDIYLPTAPVSPINRVVKITEGGTGATTREGALLALGAVDADKVNVVGGALTLGPDGKLEIVTQVVTVGSQVAVVGPKTVVVGKPATYQISNLHSPGSYTLASTNGTLTRSGDQIAFTPTAVNAATTFTVNSKPVTVNVIATTVATPSITYPLAGTANLGTSTTGVSSAFSSTTSGDVHEKTDWQVSTNSSFSSFTFQSLDDVINKTAIALSSLTQGTTYYIRVRHKGTLGGTSAWSATGSFTIPLPASINTPSITTPSNGATGVLRTSTFTSSVFAVSNGTDVHLTSDWQIATDAGFSNIVNSVSTDYSNKTTWGVGGLAYNTRYYVRVRYSGVSVGTSAWSAASTFVTEVEVVLPPKSVATPSITSPYNGQSGMETSFTLYSSAFTVNNGSDVHLTSDWQIATDSGFSNVVKSVTTDYSNKTSWGVAGLTNSTTYYARVRYSGSTAGTSSWSPAVGFSIKAPAIIVPSNETAIITPSNGASGDVFSWAMAMSSDGNVIASADARASGGVYLYAKSGSSWVYQSYIAVKVSAVALSGDGSVLVCGQYVYRRSGSTWNLVVDLLPASGSSLSDGFGSRVAVSDDGNAIAITSDAYNSWAGKVSIFIWYGSSFNLTNTLYSSSPSAGARFGQSLAFSTYGGTLVIGAPALDVGVGTVQVFKGASSQGSQGYGFSSSFTDPLSCSAGGFGMSVSINSWADTILVGSYRQDNYQGTGFIFTQSGNGYSYSARLSDATYFACNLGFSAGISGAGDIAVLGGPILAGGGSMSIFAKVSGTWQLAATKRASNNSAQNYFGWCVAISNSGQQIAIGAYAATGNIGSIYIFN